MVRRQEQRFGFRLVLLLSGVGLLLTYKIVRGYMEVNLQVKFKPQSQQRAARETIGNSAPSAQVLHSLPDASPTRVPAPTPQRPRAEVISNPTSPVDPSPATVATPPLGDSSSAVSVAPSETRSVDWMKKGYCAPVLTLADLLAPQQVVPKTSSQSLVADVSDATFAWCDDGHSKNGQFVLRKDGTTGGDFAKWSLKRWKVTDDFTITVDDGSGGNPHTLFFNCAHTGFAVKGSGKRGFIEGQNFHSPSEAGAPEVPRSPDCRPKTLSIPPAVSATLLARIPVWVWWDFKGNIPLLFRMNLRTWHRRIPSDKFVLYLVNQSNIQDFLPGLPKSFFNLYNAAKSDFLRASLLAAHGGVYLDGDMLLVHDLDVVVKDLLTGKVDVLPYEGPGDHCPASYTTNFMAGAKGNSLSVKWIDVTLEKMVHKCSLPEKENHREPVKVCCYNKDCAPRGECHVAWGDISHPPTLKELPPNSVKLGCIPNKEGLSATMTGSELFWKFGNGPVEKTTGDFHCWRAGATNSDLECKRDGKKEYLGNFWNRHGHHLYNMLQGGKLDEAGKTEEAILASKLVVGELYRIGFGL